MNTRTVRIVVIVIGVAALLVAGGLIGAAAVRDTLPDGPYLTIPAEVDSDTEPGVVVAGVVADGPAASAGVLRGDILLEIDGEPLENPGQLVSRLAGLEPGDEIQLTLERGGQELTLAVTLSDDHGKAYLGIVPCLQVPEIERRAPGVVIAEVVPGSSAADAGLEEGDVILAVDGEQVQWGESLADVIGGHEPGDRLTLQIMRDGVEQDVDVELGEHPEREGEPYLGVRYESASRVRILTGSPPEWMHWPFLPGCGPELPQVELVSGVVVLDVVPGGPADSAGVERGDLITELDGDAIESRQELIDALGDLEPGDEVVLRIFRRGEDAGERDIEVTLGERPDAPGEAYLGAEIGGCFLSGQRFGRHPIPGDDGCRGTWLIAPFGPLQEMPELILEQIEPLEWPELEWYRYDHDCVDDDI